MAKQGQSLRKTTSVPNIHQVCEIVSLSYNFIFYYTEEIVVRMLYRREAFRIQLE